MSVRQLALLIPIVAALLLPLSLFAQTPPTTQPLSVQDQMAKWQDEFDQDTPEQVIPEYSAHTDQQRAMARDFADYGVASNQIIEHARAKFGPVVEMAVAHATYSDCRDDDKSATIKIDGDHATVTFKSDNITQLLMVKEDGRWKVDLAGYEKLYGANSSIRDMLDETRQSTAIMKQADADLAQGKYDSGFALITDLTNKLNAVQPTPDQSSQAKTVRP
jgi:hypothetical protein